MKKISMVLFLFYSLWSYGQSKKENPIHLIQSELGVHYLNHDPKCNYIIDFYGDSLRQVPNAPFLEIDEKIITVTEFPYTDQDFTNSDDTNKMQALFQQMMNRELKYFEKEIYKSKLKVSEEFFNNKEGKQFLLWSFDIPEAFRKKIMRKNKLITSPVHNAYLFFVSNEVVVGISLSTNEKSKIESDLNYLKNTADRIDVFGGPINKPAWYYKLQAMNDNREFTYQDTLHHYEINIPYWFNVTESGIEGVFSGTFPDINNIKNAIAIFSHKKEEFKSFKDFNEHYITGNQFGLPSKSNKNMTWMGQKELEKPKACNGLSYKVYCMFGDMMYHCRLTTYETATAYIIINFTATAETYEANAEKLEEFLSGFDIVK